MQKTQLMYATPRDVSQQLIRMLCSVDNITGGFAGGEMGLQQFIEKGDIEIAEARQRGEHMCVYVCVGRHRAA